MDPELEVDWGMEDDFDPWQTEAEKKEQIKQDSIQAAKPQPKETTLAAKQVVKPSPTKTVTARPEEESSKRSQKSSAPAIEDSSLPPDWVAKASRKDPSKIYFFNVVTKVVSWTRPAPEVVEPETPPLPTSDLPELKEEEVKPQTLAEKLGMTTEPARKEENRIDDRAAEPSRQTQPPSRDIQSDRSVPTEPSNRSYDRGSQRDAQRPRPVQSYKPKDTYIPAETRNESRNGPNGSSDSYRRSSLVGRPTDGSRRSETESSRQREEPRKRDGPDDKLPDLGPSKRTRIDPPADSESHSTRTSSRYVSSTSTDRTEPSQKPTDSRLQDRPSDIRHSDRRGPRPQAPPSTGVNAIQANSKWPTSQTPTEPRQDPSARAGLQRHNPSRSVPASAPVAAPQRREEPEAVPRPRSPPRDTRNGARDDSRQSGPSRDSRPILNVTRKDPPPHAQLPPKPSFQAPQSSAFAQVGSPMTEPRPRDFGSRPSPAGPARFPRDDRGQAPADRNSGRSNQGPRRDDRAVARPSDGRERLIRVGQTSDSPIEIEPPSREDARRFPAQTQPGRNEPTPLSARLERRSPSRTMSHSASQPSLRPSGEDRRDNVLVADPPSRVTPFVHPSRAQGIKNDPPSNVSQQRGYVNQSSDKVQRSNSERRQGRPGASSANAIPIQAVRPEPILQNRPPAGMAAPRVDVRRAEPELRRDAPEQRREPNEMRRDGTETRRDGPDARRDDLNARREPEPRREDARRDGPDSRRDVLDSRRDPAPLRREEPRDLRRDGPEIRRDRPDIRREASDVKRNGPEPRRDVDDRDSRGYRDGPDTRRDAPLMRREDPREYERSGLPRRYEDARQSGRR